MVGGGCWLPEGPAGLLLVVAVGPAAVAGAFWLRDFSMTLIINSLTVMTESLLAGRMGAGTEVGGSMTPCGMAGMGARSLGSSRLAGIRGTGPG